MKNYHRFGAMLIIAAITFFSMQATAQTQDSTLSGRNKQQYRYIDINTGQPIKIRYDRTQRTTYDNQSNKPVDFYVNATTGDTLYGRGQYIVNGFLLNNPRGSWSLDSSRVRISEDGIYQLSDNTMLKTEKPYKSSMKKNQRRQDQ